MQSVQASYESGFSASRWPNDRRNSIFLETNRNVVEDLVASEARV